MTSRERMLAALNREQPDRLPVTTHHVMPYFLQKYMVGMSNDEFFDWFGLDPILWVVAHRPDEARKDYRDPNQGDIGFLEAERASSDFWRVEAEELPDGEYRTVRYRFITPKKTLTMVLRSNEQTTWVAERLVKEKSDIDVIGEFVTAPLCDVDEVNRQAAAWGDRGLVRGHICCFDVFGQPGCWQDASCLYGIENLIMATYDDPEWVHAFLSILRGRKAVFVRSLRGASYDILNSMSIYIIKPREEKASAVFVCLLSLIHFGIVPSSWRKLLCIMRMTSHASNKIKNNPTDNDNSINISWNPAATTRGSPVPEAWIDVKAR